MANPEPQRNEIESPEQLMQRVSALWSIRAFLTAFELELFTAISDERKTSDGVARAIGADPRATDRLLNAMVATGLLRKESGRFFNTPFTAQFLVKGKPQYLGGLGHFVHLWDTWSTLTEAVRHGTTAVPKHVNERGEKWLAAFIDAMHWRGMRAAPDVIAMLDLSNVRRVLDVGGGSGAYSIAFVKAKEGARATVFDLPNVAPLTQKYIEQAGVGDLVDTVIGDYNVNDFGTGYDLVLFSAIVHSNSSEQNEVLMQKAARALNPGGQIVIQDFIMDPDRATPSFGAIFALNMLVGTDAGDTFTEAEVRGWLEKAGLTSIERKDTQGDTALIIGWK